MGFGLAMIAVVLVAASWQRWINIGPTEPSTPVVAVGAANAG
jgi:hypothetical protein